MARTWLTAVLGTVCFATISSGRAEGQYASVYGGPGGFGFGYSAAPTYQQAPVYPPAPTYQQSPAYPAAPNYRQAPAFQPAPNYRQAPTYQFFGYCESREARPGTREGYLEGELYWETGVAPRRPLSPAEARGFAAGERRAAERSWVDDPAKQLGWQEAQVFNRTGILPNHRLSPAEMQGFQAAERRTGYAPW